MVIKRKKRNLQAAGEVLEDAFKLLGIEEKYHDLKFLEIWNKVIDEKLRNRTQAIRVAYAQNNSHRTLIIGSSSGALAQELQFLKDKLLKKFNSIAQEELGKTINDLKFTTI